MRPSSPFRRPPMLAKCTKKHTSNMYTHIIRSIGDIKAHYPTHPPPKDRQVDDSGVCAIAARLWNRLELRPAHIGGLEALVIGPGGAARSRGRAGHGASLSPLRRRTAFPAIDGRRGRHARR